MRAAIYTRISKDREGAGLGVRTQEQDCRTLAEELGATVVVVLTDNDLSAYSGKPRPGYNHLLAMIADEEIDAVLAWHTDRLHRSPAELEDYITLCETAGVRTVTVKSGHVDLSSPSGLVMARTLGAFARYEVDHARERMQRAKQRSAESGLWKGGRRPFGYEADGVTIRSAEAALIAQGSDMILAGESVRAVARAWNAAGVPTTTGKLWALAAPRRVLLRPRNAGLMEHRGKIVGEAAWPAIVAPEKWRAVVQILTDANRRTNNANLAVRWLGSGLYRCGACGSTMRVDRTRNAVPFYRCREAAHVTRDQASVDEYVSAVVVERLRQPDVVDFLRPAVPAVDVSALERRAIELNERKNQLAAMFAEGAIDSEQLAEGSRRLSTQIENVRAEVSAAYGGTAFAGIAESVDPGAAWLAATLERRRMVLDALLTVTLVPTSKGRPPGWTPGQPYFRPESVRVEWRSGGAS